ncbi:hypothetical protein WR25_14900 [Diploscapter pachys]|uniref:Ig-like domain-containing protein n=1 Tax=Diploscapter pachys TaxID=2018661 RepID=A0A2A2J4D3_9BILA|nr:hypothetical protein WR25_14900 [Diploscapter pachys]
MAFPSEMEIAPVYEIVLSREDEHANRGPVKVANVYEGDKLTFKCVGGSGMKAESVKLQKKLDDGFKDVGKRVRSSIVYDINSFSVAQHSGVYDCSAQRLDNGAEHSKMVRLQGKSKKLDSINKNATFCHMNDDFCNRQGK